MAKKTDSDTMRMLKQVAEQRKAIADAEGKPAWKTNCNLTAGGKTVSLHVETSVGVLVTAAGFLLAKETEYRAGTETLGVEPTAFRWDGYTLSEWLDDIKARVAKLTLTAKRERLAGLEKRLNAVVSPELRAQLELEAIAAEMGVS